MKNIETLCHAVKNSHCMLTDAHSQHPHKIDMTDNIAPEKSISFGMTTPTNASEEEVKRYELFSSATLYETYLVNQSALLVLLAQSILMAATVTNVSSGSLFLVCSPAIVGALILIVSFPTLVDGNCRIKSQWSVYLKGIGAEGEIIIC